MSSTAPELHADFAAREARLPIAVSRRTRPEQPADPGVAHAGRFFDVTLDSRYGVHWATLRPDAPAVFTPELVADLRRGQAAVRAEVGVQIGRDDPAPTRYQVFASAIPGVFSLGGDLRLFRRYIRSGDRESLRRYALSCIDVVHDNATGYGLPMTTISLVQGDALGGGFEAALAAHVVVAERQCKMGLPEILFNLFPGMGAVQLLARRLPAARVEEFIASGRTYCAEELHAMGLVDVLADEGCGVDAVQAYIRSHHRQVRGREALRRAMTAVEPLRYESLVATVDIWVDTALGLRERDLEVIDYLVRAQARRLS